MSRNLFLKAVKRQNRSGKAVLGTGTSVVCKELMDTVGVHFPDAHFDAKKMSTLAPDGHTVLGFDVTMPLFSVRHEAAAMGCNVNWGNEVRMPEAGRPIFHGEDDVATPPDLLTHPGCAVPLKAISHLKRNLGDDAAVCGKVFGGWTQSHHYFSLQNSLVMTLTVPDKAHRILDRLLNVTVTFARVQIEAGADCLLLADHATRDLCSPEAYRTFLLPNHARLAEMIEIPLILHICGNTSDRTSAIAETGLSCFHRDTTTGEPGEVRRLAGTELSLMGGVSSFKLLRGTPEKTAASAVTAVKGDIDIVGRDAACLDASTAMRRQQKSQRFFAVEVSDMLDVYLGAEETHALSLVVPCWTMGTITHEQEKRLLEPTRGGIGIAGWHGGMCDAFRNDVAYRWMTGGQWVSHAGGVSKYRGNILKGNDPSLKVSTVSILSRSSITCTSTHPTRCWRRQCSPGNMFRGSRGALCPSPGNANSGKGGSSILLLATSQKTSKLPKRFSW